MGPAADPLVPEPSPGHRRMLQTGGDAFHCYTLPAPDRWGRFSLLHTSCSRQVGRFSLLHTSCSRQVGTLFTVTHFLLQTGGDAFHCYTRPAPDRWGRFSLL